MAILANDGRMALEGVSQTSYSVNQTNLSNSVAVTGVQDSIYTTWAGIYGSQLNLPYNNIQSNSYLNLYTRHMGGWATVDLGTGANDVYDTVALQRTGDWVLNFQGGDKLVAGSAVAVAPQNDAYIYVNAYITSNASFNTDGSLKLVAGRSGSQDVSFESGLTGSQTWVRQKNDNTGWGASGNRYESWTVNTPSLTNATRSTAQHDYVEQNTAVGLTQNAAGDVNGTSTVTLGEGTDTLFLLNNVRTVTDFWWQSYWIFGGAWHGYTYNENAWSVYWDGDNWKAYNNFKDYTIDISTDVESVYYSYVNDDGSIDYQVFNGNSPNVNHYSGGFPGSGGGSTPNNNPTNPLSLGDSGFVPSTDTGGSGNANIQIVAPKGSTVSFHNTITGDHNEGDTTAGLRTFTQSGAQQLSFEERFAGDDSANAELGVIRITMGASIGDSQYNLYLGTRNADAAVNLTSAGATMKTLAYGFAGDDNITGTGFADTLIGGAGADILVGGAGNDSLFGGTGADNINGGLGADWIDGGDDVDTLNGSGDGSGADTVFGGVGNDNLTGGDQDVLIGGTNEDTLTGVDGIYAHTYLMDDSGTNSYVTDGGDYYYYNATSAINNVTGTSISSGTLLFEAGTTSTGSTSGSATVSFAYVSDSSRSVFYVDGTKDVIVLSGGDLFDLSYTDNYATFIVRWFTYRSYTTVNSPIANGNNRIDSTTELMTWMTDGQSSWHTNPWDSAQVGWEPADGPLYGSIGGSLLSFNTGVNNYKGYFTAYLNGYTEIFYANDASGNHDGNITVGELTYIGSIQGRFAGGYAFGSLSGFTTTTPNTQPSAPAAPTDPIFAQLASASDTGIQGDNLTNLNTGIQVTANVDATSAADVKAYIWTDSNNNGIVDGGETLSALLMTSTSITSGVYNGTLPGTFANGTTTKIILTQTISGQESEKTAAVALPITVDSVAPTSATSVSMISQGGNVVSNALNGSNTNANFSATITANELNNGGYAEFYIGSNLIGTDNSIVSSDTSVTITSSDGTPTTAELQSFISSGGVLSVKLYDPAGNLISTTGSTILVDYVSPIIDSVAPTETQLSVTTHDAWANGLNNVDVTVTKTSDNSIIYSSNDLAYGGATATFTPLAQPSVTNASIKSTDASGNIVTSSDNLILGTSGNDTINGTSNNEIIYAFGGADTITGGLGVDTIIGGTDTDTFKYSTTTATDTSNNIANMEVIVGADLNETFDLSSFPNYDAGSFIVDPDPASVGVNDYIVSWTSNNGAVTNYVYLQDSTQTGGFGVTETNGVISLTTPPAPVVLTQTVVNNYAQGSGQIAIYMDELVTGLDLARHKPLPFTNQNDFLNGAGSVAGGIQVVNIAANAVDKMAYVITTVNAQMNTGSYVDSYIDLNYFDTGVSGNYAGIVVTTDGTNTYVWADIHLGRSNETTYGTNTYLLNTISGNITGTPLTSSDFTVYSGTTSSGITNFITGTSGNDNIATNYTNRTPGNAETIMGGTGNDTLDGGAGADTLTGGADADVFELTGSDNSTDTITDWGNGADTFAGTMVGGQQLNVTMVGNTFTAAVIAAANGVVNVTGSSGNDTITGGAGNDTIIGGPGSDNMDGGTGTDVYVLNLPTWSLAGSSTGDSLWSSFDTITVTSGDIIRGLLSTNSVQALGGSQSLLDLHNNSDLVTALQQAILSNPQDPANPTNSNLTNHTYLVVISDNQLTVDTNFSGTYLVSEFDVGSGGAIDGSDVVIKLIGTVNSIAFSGEDLIIT